MGSSVAAAAAAWHRQVGARIGDQCARLEAPLDTPRASAGERSHSPARVFCPSDLQGPPFLAVVVLRERSGQQVGGRGALGRASCPKRWKQARARRDTFPLNLPHAPRALVVVEAVRLQGMSQGGGTVFRLLLPLSRRSRPSPPARPPPPPPPPALRLACALVPLAFGPPAATILPASSATVSCFLVATFSSAVSNACG